MSIRPLEQGTRPTDAASSSEAQFQRLAQVIARSQQGYRELIDSLDQALFTLSLEGEIRVANLRVVEMLGVPFQDLIGHSLGEFLDVPDLADARRALPLFLRSGTWSGTLPVRFKKDKQLRYFDCWLQALVDDGRVTSITGWARDVTSASGNALQPEHEFIHRLVECFPDMIVVLDREGRVAFVSGRAVDILGADPEKLVGQEVRSKVHPEDRARLAQLIQDINVGRRRYVQAEFRMQHLDGSWRTLRASASPLFGGADTIKGLVASVRDITETRTAERNLAQKEKFAAMGQMLAGAAHELNNPLTAILGVSDLLRERAVDDTSRRHADLILRQSRRAAAIVQDLLAFSRPAAQERQSLHLEEIVREIVHSQQPALAQKNIRVSFEVPPGLPAIVGDRRLLSQVFFQLIANAEQSISSARESGNLQISFARVGRRVCVTIADDGPGISEDLLGRIFEPFFTTKRPGGGSGLGLTICRAVVKEHGGSIEVQSISGSGAAFQVFLPVAARGTSAHARPDGVTQTASPASARLKARTVLIVEDDASIREIVQQRLAARGWLVHGVESSEAALAYMETNGCDAVLCDFNLPGMNGEDFFERVRSKKADSMPAFIFMTGDLADAVFSPRLREAGAHVLQKPFQVAALAAILEKVLPAQTSPAH